MTPVEPSPLPPVKPATEAPRPSLGVSACLFRGGDVLLVRRSKPPYAGRFSLPGGRVDFGETLARAARRELLEETGIDAPLAFLRLHEAIEAEAGVHAVIAVFAGEIENGAEPVAGDDADAVLLADEASFAAMEADGRLTPGLGEIVRAARAERGAAR